MKILLKKMIIYYLRKTKTKDSLLRSELYVTVKVLL